MACILSEKKYVKINNKNCKILLQISNFPDGNTIITILYYYNFSMISGNVWTKIYCPVFESNFGLERKIMQKIVLAQRDGMPCTIRVVSAR